MRYEDEQNENEEGSEQMECPHCGRMFMCGGAVRAATGGEIEGDLRRKKGHGMKGGIYNTGADLPMDDDVQRKKGHGMKGGIYAEGGEIEPSRWKKREANLPDLELDVYRGEGVARGDPEEEEEKKRIAYARELRRRRGY